MIDTHTDTLTKMQLAGVLRHYGRGLQRAEPVSGGFSGARVWRVTTSEGSVIALRCSAAADPELRQQRLAVCRWMRWAGEQGHEWAPRPLEVECSPFDRHEFLVNQGEFVWQAEEWMSGEAVMSKPSPGQLRAALETLGQLQRTGRDFVLRSGSMGGLRLAVGRSPGLERRLQIVQSLGAGELELLLAAAQRHANEEFRNLAVACGHCLRERLGWLEGQLRQSVVGDFMLQPVLRDLWKPHVLFTGNVVTGVIDWNAAATDHVAFDYARLLCSWYGREAVDAANVNEILPEEWTVRERQLWRLCCESVLLLSPVTWLRRLCGNGGRSSSAGVLTAEVLERFREVAVMCGAGRCER